MLEPGNLRKALERVRRNRGAPGVDGMTVEELGDYLKEQWPGIRAQLLEGRYSPQPVRRVEIPKAGGGMRPLGVPTVLDRFIQQAVGQVLGKRWDSSFSESSYGFRPGRSAHQAVRRLAPIGERVSSITPRRECFREPCVELRSSRFLAVHSSIFM